MPENNYESEWISRQAGAKRLGVSPRTMNRLIDDGVLTCRQILGANAWVRADEVEALLAASIWPAKASVRAERDTVGV
jgi:hypothetical protein